MWDAIEIWWVGLKDEFVHANGDRSDEEGIEFLVVLRADENQKMATL